MAVRKKVGIKDISREAGVAISTVSHVLNGTAPISAEVRARVVDAARRLGYLAERQAKATITALDTVVLAVPDDAIPENEINLFSWTVLNGLTRECERRGVRLVPLTGNGSLTARKIVETAQAESADGVLLLNDDRREVLHGICNAGIPAVLINGEDQEMKIDSVTPGNRFAAQLATNWLISQGHRTILHLTWEGRTTIRRRRDGFIDAFKANDLPLADARVLHAGGYEPKLGEKAIARWLAESGGLDGVTAIFCAADNLALGAMRALHAAGIRIPENVSVMGFDGVALGELVTPPLTTVYVPLNQMGPEALHLLEQRVLANTTERAAHRLELGCKLVIRRSVATLGG
ncbi:LacI family DNA-binding transcriptional regulator [Chelativorans salis]|uniref:LacI family transcriptional regulator n=1 Tax=Chelativorans salis TaxID=2978478 RepID=A0ABT2LUK7_9HYPH|nr:LacI family DNA-binding transcriptional regulator [Chelativorans sp. EGI FJ00035]MCT7378202.1 LacI family transcriptional regulator [Chelativorans sp. EGI FJ00035]